MNEKSFHKQRPFLFVLSLQLIILVVAIIVGAVTKRLGLHVYVLYGTMLAVLSLITALTVWKMNWWKTIGFKRFPKKELYLLIVPAIPMIGNLFGSYKAIEPKLYFSCLLLTIMSGFFEEGMYRGLMLRALFQKGIWIAAVTTSVLFSLSHSMNVLAGWPWQHVALQIIYSFAIGFGWAAFAIRTGTIWPLMLIHFLNNFFSFIKTENLIKTLQSNEPSLMGVLYTVVISIVFILYGIVVLRSYKKNTALSKPLDDNASLTLAY